MPTISNPATKPTVIAPVLLTIPQAAQALQVSDRTVYNLLAAGQLKSIRIGSSRRIRVADVEAFSAAGIERDNDLRGILLRQRDDLNTFVAEWQSTTDKSLWVESNAENIRLLEETYRKELSRLLSHRSLTPEWSNVLTTAQPVVAKVLKRLKRETSELPLSDPKTLADRAYSFVTNAGTRFGNSLVAAREQSQVVENDE